MSHPTCSECGGVLLICSGQLMCVIKTCPKWGVPVETRRSQ